MKNEKPRIAIVHEWLTGMRGGEKCVEALCEVFPDATIYTLVHVPSSVSARIEQMPIRTSFIQHLPWAASRYRNYLPLFPRAIEQFDLREYDIVISSNHAVAKGVKTAGATLHICYCHTPMRYIWNLYDEYFGKGKAGFVTRIAMNMVLGYLRRWDVRTAQNPRYFVANSENVRRRIKAIYHRDADVIFPPVDTSFFRPTQGVGDYFLIVSAFVPYKRIDLAIETFNGTGERLVIIGNGPDNATLRSMAKSNIEFLGWQPDDRLRDYYSGCKALIFPGEEDFGIVPLEAMATARPVIAFAKGGALETVIDGETGILFGEQTVESLSAAIERYHKSDFSADRLRRHAVAFDREQYKNRMREYILERWNSCSTGFPQV